VKDCFAGFRIESKRGDGAQKASELEFPNLRQQIGGPNSPVPSMGRVPNRKAQVNGSPSSVALIVGVLLAGRALANSGSIQQ
jgi:hypothetical protein